MRNDASEKILKLVEEGVVPLDRRRGCHALVTVLPSGDAHITVSWRNGSDNGVTSCRYSCSQFGRWFREKSISDHMTCHVTNHVFSRGRSVLFFLCITHHCQYTMPKIRTQRTKPPPEGYEDIQYALLNEITDCWSLSILLPQRYTRRL